MLTFATRCGSPPLPTEACRVSTVALGDSLDFVLLLDGVGVGTGAGALGGGDDFVGENFADALDVAESRLSGASGDQVDGLVHAAQGRHVDGLTADHTARADTGRVLAGATGGDSVDQDLEGVLTGLEVDELESLSNNADSHLLLAAVATLHHEGVGEALNNGAVDFLETSLLIAASSEGHEDLGLDGLDVEVSHERDILALNALVGPATEELDLGSVLNLGIVSLDDVTIYSSKIG